MVEILFRAYFSEGRNLGDANVLAELAALAGIERPRAEAMLAGTEGSDEVAGEEEIAMRAGLSGVPTFVLDGRVLFSGAQSPELIARALSR
jgi:predicted DsbA family dithiol-disulfide isomerase